MKNLFVFAALSVLTFTSCSKHRLKGEGSIVSETRSVSGFSNISLNGSEDVEIIPSKENKVIVSGYQNLVPSYKTKVSGSTLNLEFERNYYNVRNNNIKVTIYTTGISKIEMNGSGNISLRDSLKTDRLRMEINGSGNIYTYNNYIENVELDVNGSGNINARNTTGRYVYAEISGSGDIEITAQEKLEAKISGSGEIKYWGNPSTVNTDVSGSGRVRKQ